MEAPLLGDALRRGCEAPMLRVHACSAALSSALQSAETWHTLEVDDVGAATRRPVMTSVAAGQVPWRRTAAEANEEEELALKVGYAEHLEDEFFGGEQESFDEDDEWDSEFAGDEDMWNDEENDGNPVNAAQQDFLAKLAALQAESRADQRPDGSGV